MPLACAACLRHCLWPIKVAEQAACAIYGANTRTAMVPRFRPHRAASVRGTFRVLQSGGPCHLKGEILKGLVGRPSPSERALSPYSACSKPRMSKQR